jgi:hypothetical protein
MLDTVLLALILVVLLLILAALVSDVAKNYIEEGIYVLWMFMVIAIPVGFFYFVYVAGS